MTMSAHKEQVSADKFLVLSTVEDCYKAQDQFATLSTKLQTAERALTLAFDQLKEYFGSVQMAEVAVEGQMTSNF